MVLYTAVTFTCLADFRLLSHFCGSSVSSPRQVDIWNADETPS